MFNFFKKKENSVSIDEMNNELLKENIKNMVIDVLNKHNIIVNDNIVLNFKYLNRNNNGLQSMFIAIFDNNNYYFCISNNDLQLLKDSAKDFFIY